LLSVIATESVFRSAAVAGASVAVKLEGRRTWIVSPLTWASSL
jgi:hypothetical protein